MKIIITPSFLALLAVPVASYDKNCHQEIMGNYCDGEPNYNYRQRGLYDKSDSSENYNYRKLVSGEEQLLSDQDERALYTYSHYDVPSTSPACQTMAQQCGDGATCYGASMNSYGSGSASGSGGGDLREQCGQQDCDCQTCKNNNFDCGNCPNYRLRLLQTGTEGEGENVGMINTPSEGEGIGMINTPNEGEGENIGMINTPGEGEGENIGMINTPGEGQGIGMINTPQVGKGFSILHHSGDMGNLSPYGGRNLQEEVSLDWVAVALENFNCSEGCLVNFYDTNECTDAALRPLSPMAGISVTYSTDDSGKTLGKATVPGPIEQYLDKVIYFHDNMDGEIGIDEGKDLCGIFQELRSEAQSDAEATEAQPDTDTTEAKPEATTTSGDTTTSSVDTTAANDSGADLPRAASYLAGVSVMVAIIMAS